MQVHTIVVGAGSGGAVVAHRLSERSDRDVLLIEAGPDYTPKELPEPLANGRLNAFTHDWGHWHTPARGQIRKPLPRGQVVGGSSAVNTCIAIRALPRDIDEWAARGLSEWTWEQALPAFCAIEADQDFDTPWHGTDGPLPLRRHPASEQGTWHSAFLQAARDAGHPACEDHNNPNTPEGAGPHAMNKRNGRRISAAEAWLTPSVRARDNLSLLTEARVLHVRFEGDRAAGVAVEHNGTVRWIGAQRVVLCAGAIQTPRLLMRSGIGPQAELERLGVQRRVDLPGLNRQLLDHPGFAFFLRPRRAGVYDRECGLIQAALRVSIGDAPSHDVQIQAGSFLPIGRKVFPLVSMMAMLGKPRGTGTIRWPSLDDGVQPAIDSHFLDDPHDRARAVTALQVAYGLTQEKAMRDLARPFLPPRFVLRDSARLGRWIRWFCDSGYHPSGTAPMGTEDDPHAVVDGRGRVHGTEGLYVADASIMPTIPTGNIHLTTLMIGERIGCWLRDDG